MASMGGGYLDPEPVVRMVKNTGLINRLLSQICQYEGLKSTGVKADLQQRIMDRIRQAADMKDVTRFNRLKGWLENPATIPVAGSSYNYGGSASPGASVPPYSNHSSPYNANSSNNYRAMPTPGIRMGSQQNLIFKASPFYKFEKQLGPTKPCDTMAQHRHTVTITLKAMDYPILSTILDDPSKRVMVFCAGEGHGLQDIAFPHQSEIKVNGGEVKANLRGLKNKPGSTRPVDITKELRLKLPAYPNNVEMVYALTHFSYSVFRLTRVDLKKFFLSVWVVTTTPVIELVKQLEGGKRISKESVVNTMISKARDADIVATASVLSLKCPLSTLRIALPIRGITCRHNQCFDATSYLQLQEQGPTWQCPICNNPAPFDSLAVDEYVRDILKNTPKSAEQVTIEPEGQWKLYHKEQPSSNTNGFRSDDDDDDDDDDLIEVTKTGQTIKDENFRSTNQIRTPSAAPTVASREQSTPSRPTSGKRPIAAVIDLTSSGDEDEEPVSRPPKRQHQSNGTTLHSIPSMATPPSSNFAVGTSSIGPPRNGLSMPAAHPNPSPLNSNGTQQNGATGTMPMWGSTYGPRY
ncbi:PINIT domain-containing protein [Xylogone sp. PMI_703]|nr:PINIT domain-containing protein [Xylogone sp. PMI_703]